jgi:hypothetical protein
MYLTKEEEKLLESDNDTVRKCMEILVALGEIFEADKLIKVNSVQISGISYQNIGDAGLEWFESLEGKFVVPAMVNPAGMDIQRWKEMGIDEGFYRKQIRIIEALKKLGAEETLTCTPYYLHIPDLGEHVAWAESNAVVYANSVIGARTNRESGISALASGIIGKTPNYGLHIDENRKPTVIVEVSAELSNEADLSVVGYIAGERLTGHVPYFRFRKKLPVDWLKLLGASLAAKGNTAIFHVENQTPEWNLCESNLEKIEIDDVELSEFSVNGCEPDLIALGCPHMSSDEIKYLLEIMEKKGGKVKKDFWIFTSRRVLEETRDLVERIESFGAKVFTDTCMVVSPATEAYECVMVNSGKALTYLPKLRKVDVTLGSMKDCIDEAFK